MRPCSAACGGVCAQLEWQEIAAHAACLAEQALTQLKPQVSEGASRSPAVAYTSAHVAVRMHFVLGNGVCKHRLNVCIAALARRA